MTVTKLNSEYAFIVIDLQKVTMGSLFVQQIADVIVYMRKLLNAFRDAKQTVVSMNAVGSFQNRNEVPHSNIEFPDDWTDLIPELDAHICIDSTTREAHSRGFITLAVNAMSDLIEQVHASGVSRIVSQLGKVSSRQDIVYKLAVRRVQP